MADTLGWMTMVMLTEIRSACRTTKAPIAPSREPEARTTMTGSPTNQKTDGARLLLASRSPRRREMLHRAGFEHEAEHPGFEDGALEPGGATPEQWVASLAYLKAWAKAREVSSRRDRPPEAVIGADTACVVDGRLVGTPNSEAEAEAMIRAFIGREHEVITGVAIIAMATGRREIFVDHATVRFGHLSDEAVRSYAASGLWAGKAGAYNLSERLDAGWPITFTGDAGTIMGLPLHRIRPILERLGIRPAGEASR